MTSVDTMTTTDRTRGGCGCGGGCGGSRCAPDALTQPDALVGLERPRFFARQVVGPDDLNQVGRYLDDRRRSHNRFLHGWGIACGLRVTRCGPTDEKEESCRVRVSAGYALDPYGDELLVPEPVVVDLCATDVGGGLLCAPTADPWCAPVPVPARDAGRYLAVRHVELPVKPVRSPAGCSCSDTVCEESRVRDWFEFTLLDDLPSHYGWPCGDDDDFCASVADCPPCPDSGWIVLARVRVKDGSLVDLALDDRRYLLSLTRFCLRCDTDDSWNDQVVAGDRPRKEYVAAASADPDTTVAFAFYHGDEKARLAVTLRADDVTGVTADKVKALLDDVVVFDTATGRPVVDSDGAVLKAGIVLSHTPLRGGSVIDGPRDLEVRVGRPQVDTVAYRAAVEGLAQLLDDAGRKEFETRALGNLSALDAIDVSALSGISTANATRLRDDGIRTLADLRTADRVPTLSAGAAMRAARFRGLDLGGRG